MYITIDFEKVGHSHLRNGLVRTKGLNVCSLGEGDVLLSAVKPDGGHATGNICIQTDELPEVIQALARIYLDSHPLSADLLRERLDAALKMDGRDQPTAPPEDLDAIEIVQDGAPGMR